MIKKLNQREALLMFVDWLFDKNEGLDLETKPDFYDLAVLVHAFANANNFADCRDINEVLNLAYVPTVETNVNSTVNVNVNVVLEHRKNLYNDAEETTDGVVN